MAEHETPVIVLIFLRDVQDLSSLERTVIEQAFPGRRIDFRRIDSSNCFKYDQICSQIQPDFVLLPPGQPILSIAMERGVPHVTVSATGQLVRLRTLVAEFEPYPPPPD